MMLLQTKQFTTQKTFTTRLLFVVFATLLSSCLSEKLPDVNANFEKKFGKDVAKIKAERSVNSAASEVNISQSQFSEDFLRSEQKDDYYAYVDVNRFNDRAPEVYLPNGESYEQSRAANPANTLPPDIFEIRYNLGVYSAFRRVGAEFDLIAIPPQDAYGVKTKMSDKIYLLAGNDALQRNIDQINANKGAEDIENSEILIKEKKALKRKAQMQKAFGDNEIVIISSAKKDEKPKK